MRVLTETNSIKYEINRTGDSMGHMDHAHNPALDYLRGEVSMLNQGM